MSLSLAFRAILLMMLACSASDAAQPSAEWKAQVERDWLVQLERRRLSPAVNPATPGEDALGAVDGIKDGKWGFHTLNEPNPWWQVDLGEIFTLGRIVVYNRCDGGTGERAARMRVLVSTDGVQWRQVHDCGGTAFGGIPDRAPLVVQLREVQARFVRCQLPHEGYFHLDEVEVYPRDDNATNIALWKPADQSSVSQWSVKHERPTAASEISFPISEVIQRGQLLATDLRRRGVDVEETLSALDELAAAARELPERGKVERRQELYYRARWLVRELALRNPLLDFDRILFVQRQPAQFSHMSDQYYGWWSRPGGGIYILEGFCDEKPRVTCITEGWPEGTFLRPDISYDGAKVLFAYCRYYPETAMNPNKVDKSSIPEDAFFHVYEMNIDGSGVRRLTRGKYDDFDARYLPNGDIVFLSTRRGQAIRCGTESALATLLQDALPDSYVRCGGDNHRPVAIYTLHVMDANGERIRAISPFENFEWTPSIANDGRILYARWDYVDRTNMPFMSLWSTRPDGTHPEIVYGNFTRSPHCIFEARPIPSSHKLIFTASAHHSITGGSLVLLDPAVGVDGVEPITRLTPEVCFPEAEGWPGSYYLNPYPLAEQYYLTAWSYQPLQSQGTQNATGAIGVYYFDAFGTLELLYRAPAINCMYPLPLKPRPRPPILPNQLNESDEGRMVLLNVYDGLPGIKRGTVKALRIVGVPPKTQPHMNAPVLGITGDDPGKFVLGTVPVEPDGSAYFHVPAGVSLFFQALDGQGFAVQTMRTVTYVQPGQTLSCIGCHEPRADSPANASALAMRREPSKIRPGPDGSWPLRFDTLVQPILDRLCIRCHRPDSTEEAKHALDLTPASAYMSLITYGNPSLQQHVQMCYSRGESVVGQGTAATSPLLKMLQDGHRGVKLGEKDLERLITWMDTYAQVRGSFSDDQEQRLRELRSAISWMLDERAD
ncbi:MAG: HzsA-related protein [Candidatus Zipacnadales bacterium]